MLLYYIRTGSPPICADDQRFFEKRNEDAPSRRPQKQLPYLAATYKKTRTVQSDGQGGNATCRDPLLQSDGARIATCIRRAESCDLPLHAIRICMSGG